MSVEPVKLRDSDTPRPPATPSQVLLAMGILMMVPSILLMVYFIMQACSLSDTLMTGEQGLGRSLATTLTLSVILGALMWGLMTLYSFWNEFVSERFKIHRVWVWLMLAPIAILGPFYYFAFTGVLSFKLKNRNGLIWSLPGFLAGYGLIMQIDQILLGEFMPCWLHALMTPGLLLLAFVSGVGVLKILSQGSLSRQAWYWVGGMFVVWLGLHSFLWISTIQAEDRMAQSVAELEGKYGKPLTMQAMAQDYLHDGQQPTTAGLFAECLKEPAAEAENPRRPAMPDAALLLALEQSEPDEKTLAEFQAWLKDNEEFFPAMDEATSGPLFKAAPESLEADEYLSRRIFNTIAAWTGIYRARIYLAMRNGIPEQALEAMKHVAWLRATAQDDVRILLSVYSVNYLNIMYLGCYSQLLGEGMLTDGQLAELDRALAVDEASWEERARRGEWAIAAWYLSQIQHASRTIVTTRNIGTEIVLGFLGSVRLWLLRQNGRWAMRRLLETWDESSNSMAALEKEKDAEKSYPAYAGALESLLTHRHQCLPSIAKHHTVRCALAVERFKLEHDGAKPAVLSELAPKYLPMIPKDPFTGAELKYRREDFLDVRPDPEKPSETLEQVVLGFQIYSVGWDKIDNEGRLFVKGGDSSQGDIGIAVRKKADK